MGERTSQSYARSCADARRPDRLAAAHPSGRTHGPFVPVGRPMTRCYPAPAVRTPIALFAFAVLVRILLVILYPDPAYPDSFYYVNVAHALHVGQGFNIDFIWTFVDTGGVLPAHPGLPIPSNAHWTPLASLIQLPFMAILGTSPMVGMIPFILIGATAAPLTWAIARDAGARPMVCFAAGLLTAVPFASTVFMGQPDHFSIYQPFGAAALWLGARSLRGRRWAFPLAGLMVGLAALS